LDHGTKYCKESPTIEEETLHVAILHAINSVMSNRDKLIDILRTNLAVTLSEKSNTNVNPLVIENRIRELEGITMELVTIAQKTGDSESYESKFTALKNEIGALRQTLEQCRAKQNGPDELTQQIDDICDALRNAPFEITEYSNNVVRQLIDTIKVVNEDKLLIIFKGGFQMEQPLVGYEGDEMYEAS
jgi:uncharacterized coiled-coil DUF342 family protein